MSQFRDALDDAPWSIKLSFGVVSTLTLVVLFAGVIAPFSPNATDLPSGNLPPVFAGGTWEHPLGTDQLGRDLLSRNIYGMRTSMTVAIAGIAIGGAVGVVAGLISGYFGGLLDRIIMGLVDFQLAVPYTLILLMGIVLFGTDLVVMIAMLGLAYWENYARVVRGLVLSVRTNQYIEAAHSTGATSVHIIRRHIVPNIVPVYLVMFALYFPSILALESSLSFLGIGIQPPTATLGRLVADGRDQLITAPWITLIPALVILLLALLVQTIGDWLRDALGIGK